MKVFSEGNGRREKAFRSWGNRYSLLSGLLEEGLKLGDKVCKSECLGGILGLRRVWFEEVGNNDGSDWDVSDTSNTGRDVGDDDGRC